VSGRLLPAIPKRTLDFATLASGATQEVILADRVPLLHWRELTLIVRVHSHTLLSSANTIIILVYPQSWTSEDPDIQFVTTSAAGGVTLGPATPSPTILNCPVATVGYFSIAALARITALASRQSAGVMQAALSLEFSSKDA